MVLLLSRYLLTFWKRISLSGYIWLLQITGYLQLEATDWEKNEKIDQTYFDFVRRIQNIDDFKKNLIRAATDLVESRLFQRQCIAFSEDETGHFKV